MARIVPRPDNGIFYAEFEIDGVRRRVSTGSRTRREAQKIADERESVEREQRRLVDSPTILATYELFLSEKENVGIKASTLSTYRKSLEEVYLTLGDFNLESLTVFDISRHVARRNKTSRYQARADLRVLSSFYSHMKWTGRLPADFQNPIAKFDKRGAPSPKPRTTFLTEAQIEFAIEQCKFSKHKLFFLMAVDTGMRKSEMLNLHVDEIDMARRCFVIGNVDTDRTKTGEGRMIPLTDRLYDALVTHLEKTKPWKGYVFENRSTGKPMRTIKTWWRNLTKRAKLEGVRIHDLRHTFGTRGLHAGIDMRSQMAIMGHKDVRSYQRYSHVSEESIRSGITRLETNTRGR